MRSQKFRISGETFLIFKIKVSFFLSNKFFVINLKNIRCFQKIEKLPFTATFWTHFSPFLEKDHFQTYFLCTTGTCMLIFRDPSTTTLRPSCDHQQTPLRSQRPPCLRSGGRDLPTLRIDVYIFG